MLTPLVCLALAWNEPAAAELVVRHHSLADLRAGTRVVAVVPLPLREGNDSWLDLDEHEDVSPDPDLVMEFVRRVVDPDQWEYAGRAIEHFDEDVVEVVAPPHVQEKVERVIDFVRRVVTTPLTVRVDVLRIPGDGALPELPSGAPGAAVLRALEDRVAAGALTRDASFRVPLVPGEPTLRTRLSRQAYLRDFDTEIAEAAAVLQPIVDDVELGVSLALRADRSRGGDALVQFALRDTWLVEMIEEACEFRYVAASDSALERARIGGTLQAPRVGFASLAGSCILARGETGLAWASPAACGERADGVLVAITLEESPQVPRTLSIGGRTLLMMDVGGDVARGLSAEELGRTTLRWPPTARFGGEPFLTQLPIRPRDEQGMDRFQRALERAEVEVEADDEWIEFGLRGTLVFAFGSTDTIDHAVRAIAAVPGAPRGRQVTCRAGGSAFASLPAAAGEAFAVCGIQETYISDYDVDVATRVHVANPIVSPGASGCVVHVRPLSGAPAARVTLSTHVRDGGRRPFDSGSESVSMIHQPRFLASSTDRVVTAGDETTLGTIAVPSSDEVLVRVSVAD